MGGNHDLRLGDEFAERAREYEVRLLQEEPLDLAGVRVSGVAVARGTAPPQYVGQHADDEGDGPLVVVASHFPILSEASRLAAAGLPYPADLADRAEPELRRACAASPRPKLVLSGHIHSRTSTDAGPLLQSTVGAVIEPPFDATIVEI